MKKIGILFGIENSFPGALVEHINTRHIHGISAEFVQIGAIPFGQKPRYAVIVDRISHSIPFYRAFLKQATLNGCYVINDPFWASADDKFFNYALAAKIGIAVPPTVLLPHKQLPDGTTDRSMRNLEYPLDWEAVFATVGERGYLKPIDGGGWRDVHCISNREEFFRAYDESGTNAMIYQKAIEYTEYFRCYVVGQKDVRIMAYDPRRPHAERYVQDAPASDKKLLKRIEQDAIQLCTALGYDFNTVEFAVENGIPYAIDFMNPVPDADLNSIGQANFDWIVESVADLVIAKAKAAPNAQATRWISLAGSEAPPTKTKVAETKAAEVEKQVPVKPAKAAKSPTAAKTAKKKAAATVVAKPKKKSSK